MTTDKSKNFFRVSAEDFKKIPGSPIAYWVSDGFLNAFNNPMLGDFYEARVGMATGRNAYYLRLWSEISQKDIGFSFSRTEAQQSGLKWFPYNKGGEFRRWYGNRDYVVNWQNDGIELQTTMHPDGTRIWAHNFILDKIFKPGISWTVVSSGKQSFRYAPQGCLFDAAAGVCQTKSDSIEENKKILLFFNSYVADFILKLLNPTINLHPGYIEPLPFVSPYNIKICDALLKISQQDWDSYETSWDFQRNPLCISPQERAEQLSYGIHSEERAKAVSLISERYMRLRCDWQRQTEEMRNLEIENNRIFIDAYGLQDELSPEVPWNEITLTCNPWYRYGKKPEDMDLLGNSFYMNISEGKVMPTSKQEEDCPAGDFPFGAETEQRLLEDTIKEFISYAVGCMMGRYSPEKPGLILANQGSTVDDYAKIMSNFDEHLDAGDLIEQTTMVYGPGDYIEKSFCGTRYHQIIDADGVLPILDEEWFLDDIVTQFKNFVAFIFGKENLTANMDFIEAVLGKDIRKYFVKDFYKEHIQRYKKRPIYWLFSSPKGSFNALIYLHRYTPDTVSIVLNEYLRELMTKISTRIKHLIEENNRADISNADKTRNLKQIDKYTAQLAELEDYERDVIFPLAQQKIAIDLDDGVKVNYCKFGAALKKIPGLEAKEE